MTNITGNPKLHEAYPVPKGADTTEPPENLSLVDSTVDCGGHSHATTQHCTTAGALEDLLLQPDTKHKTPGSAPRLETNTNLTVQLRSPTQNALSRVWQPHSTAMQAPVHATQAAAAGH